VVKTITDPYAGRLTIFRVFSGKPREATAISTTEKGEPRALQPAPEHPRQGAETGPRRRPGRHRRGGQAQGNRHRRHPLRRIGQGEAFTPVEPMPTLISFALSAKNKGDEDKIFTSLTG
jgi:elongation factor G